MAMDREQSTEVATSAPAGADGGPTLRLVDRRAFVGFPALSVAPGLTITDFGLQIPDVTFPFNLSGGPSRYQRKQLHFGFLELKVDAELIARKVAELSAKLPELEDLKLHFRPGYLEGQARMKSAERTRSPSRSPSTETASASRSTSTTSASTASPPRPPPSSPSPSPRPCATWNSSPRWSCAAPPGSAPASSPRSASWRR